MRPCAPTTLSTVNEGTAATLLHKTIHYNIDHIYGLYAVLLGGSDPIRGVVGEIFTSSTSAASLHLALPALACEP